jgi:hypothetical protein
MPLTTEDLERWGAKVGKPASADEIAARDRRLKSAELENRQKLWRWLILGVLGLLAVETALAGRLAKRTTTTSTPGQSAGSASDRSAAPDSSL